MTNAQIEHVESQLISFIDRVIDQKENAARAEVEALPGAVSALAKLHLCAKREL